MLKEYLSWSQLDAFERGQYKRQYIAGERIPVNRGMALGKKVADALQENEATGDPITDLTIAMLPKFENMDWEYRVTASKINVPLYSKIDTCKEDLSAFKEYKTGTTKWNQEKANKSGQITFYAVVLYEITGKIPGDIELVWAPSIKKEDGRVELTGDVIIFKTKRTTADILKMKIRMKKAWEGIGRLISEEL